MAVAWCTTPASKALTALEESTKQFGRANKFALWFHRTTSTTSRSTPRPSSRGVWRRRESERDFRHLQHGVRACGGAGTERQMVTLTGGTERITDQIQARSPLDEWEDFQAAAREAVGRVGSLRGSGRPLTRRSPRPRTLHVAFGDRRTSVTDYAAPRLAELRTGERAAASSDGSNRRSSAPTTWRSRGACPSEEGAGRGEEAEGPSAPSASPWSARIPWPCAGSSATGELPGRWAAVRAVRPSEGGP